MRPEWEGTTEGCSNLPPPPPPPPPDGPLPVVEERGVTTDTETLVLFGDITTALLSIVRNDVSRAEAENSPVVRLTR